MRCASLIRPTAGAPAVGRISDAHRKQQGVDRFPIERDPGVLAALEMRNYLKNHHYETEVMPCAFRTIEQVMAVADCARIALPVKLLELLRVAAPTV